MGVRAGEVRMHEEDAKSRWHCMPGEEHRTWHSAMLDYAGLVDPVE